ncbi:NUDIX hydrolase [Candidatus Woesearchaeota archaeon]|nr:NUDIX hydrolase [Candidatus Woesearchaeota archaeon]
MKPKNASEPMLEKPEIIKKETKHKGWLELVIANIQSKDNNLLNYQYEIVNAGQGVLVLPFIDDKTLLLSLQYRLPQDELNLELIGGGKKKNETPEQAGLRELVEETGYTGCVEQFLMVQPAPAIMNLKVYIMRATNLKKVSEPQTDWLERMEIIIVSYEQILKEVLRGLHKDCMLNLAVLYNKMKYS